MPAHGWGWKGAKAVGKRSGEPAGCAHTFLLADQSGDAHAIGRHPGAFAHGQCGKVRRVRQLVLGYLAAGHLEHDIRVSTSRHGVDELLAMHTRQAGRRQGDTSAHLSMLSDT